MSVCCEDGLWKLGRVTSMRTSPLETNKMFAVKLEAGSESGEWRESDIYGPGFLTSLPFKTQLVEGQGVFVTHNGREVEGSVVKHLSSQVGLNNSYLVSRKTDLLGSNYISIEIRMLTQV